MTRSENAIKTASELLVHYFRNAGAVHENDHVVEIELIVENLVDGIRLPLEARIEKLENLDGDQADALAPLEQHRSIVAVVVEHDEGRITADELGHRLAECAEKMDAVTFADVMLTDEADGDESTIVTGSRRYAVRWHADDGDDIIGIGELFITADTLADAIEISDELLDIDFVAPAEKYSASDSRVDGGRALMLRDAEVTTTWTVDDVRPA